MVMTDQPKEILYINTVNDQTAPTSMSCTQTRPVSLTGKGFPNRFSYLAQFT